MHKTTRLLTAVLALATLGGCKPLDDGMAAIFGRSMRDREGLQDPDRPAMVGLKTVNPTDKIGGGAHFLEHGAAATMKNDLGWVASVAWSPELANYIGIGFIKGGMDRNGDRVRAWDGVRGTDVEVEICSPHMVDPEG